MPEIFNEDSFIC